MFETFHCEGNRRASRDGIEQVFVTQFIDFGDQVQVVDAAVRAKSADRFIFRPAVLRYLAVHRHLALAAHRAGIAASPRREQIFLVGFPFDIVHVFEGTLAEIPGWQDAARVERLDNPRSAAVLQVGAGGVLFDFLRRVSSREPSIVRNRRPWSGSAGALAPR